MSVERKLGWVPETVASRVKLHTKAMRFRIAKPFTAPPEINHRPWRKKHVEDQLSLGSCVGHGSSSGAEVLHYIDTKGEEKKFSRMAAYIWAQMQDNLDGRDQGAMVSGALKACQDIGHCEEKYWKYNGKYSTKEPEGARDNAGLHKIIGQHAILHSYSEVFQWLASGAGVVLIGIPWYESFADSNGVIEKAAGRNLGGHCIFLDGYSTKKDSNGFNYIDSENSHGTSYGDDGFTLWSPSLIQWMCKGISKGNEIIGITDIMDDRPIDPRPFDWMVDYPNI